MTREAAFALAPRLAAVAALVPEGARAADVGCDHGLLALHLAASGRCAAVVATEADAATLARVRRPAPRVAWRAGDGLAALSVADRVDTVVLAGLGGATIARILSSPRLRELAPRRLVVQPQTDVPSVRRFLVDHGWAFAVEAVARDRGRLYEIAAVEPGDGEPALSHPALSRDEVLEAGPLILREASEEAVALWEARTRRLETVAPARAAQARRILAALRGQTLTS